LRRSARHLLWFFAADTIATMTPNRVREYWEWRRTHSTRTIDDTEIAVVDLAREIAEGKGRPTADGTIIRELAGVLRPAVQHAIHERRLVAGTYYIPVPAQPAGRDYWITRSDTARLVWESRRDKRVRLHLPLYTLIALYTGQRRGAVLDLTWPQINWDRQWINFNPPGRVQTAKRRPIIPVPRSLMAALRHAQARATSPFVIAYAYSSGGRVGNVKKGFNSAAERAGIPDCTSHTLRHTAGTWMAQRGVPLYEIAGYLGHSEKRTTELYAHHHPDHMARARVAMESH
jgi:integrase